VPPAAAASAKLLPPLTVRVPASAVDADSAAAGGDDEEDATAEAASADAVRLQPHPAPRSLAGAASR
jgi:hypothetical protein